MTFALFPLAFLSKRIDTEISLVFHRIHQLSDPMFLVLSELSVVYIGRVFTFGGIGVHSFAISELFWLVKVKNTPFT